MTTVALMEVENHVSMETVNHAAMEVDNPEPMYMDTDTTALTEFIPPTPLSDNNEQPDTETLPNKRRRKKSVVWEHFTIETIGPGCTRACCKQCKRSFAYITGSKLAGTSHLKRHIALGICPVSRQREQLAQGNEPGKTPVTPKRRYRTTNPEFTPTIPLDQERCSEEIAKMIIMHDYPLHMVEHSGFINFVRALQPKFNMASFNTIQGDCVTMFLSQKQRLLESMRAIPGRVNIMLDLWTSDQTFSYVFLTGQFIDSEWNLHRQLLNVLMVASPDSDNAMDQPVAACLSDWCLDRKLFTLTVDHSLVNGTAIGNLRGFISLRNPLVLDSQLLVGNCYSKVIGRLAQDALVAMTGMVKRIRDCVKYVKAFESNEEKFYSLKRQLQVPSTKSLNVDDQTKWNTTYHMLVAACELKEVFSCLETCDPNHKIAISVDEWKQVEILCSYLKLFFDAANILTAATYPTANSFYHEASKVQLELTHAASSADPFVRSLTEPLKAKFDSYWNSCFLILAIAVVMDPRFKMKLVEFSFPKIYGEDAGMWIKMVDDGIHELYSEYRPLPSEAFMDYTNSIIPKVEASNEVHFQEAAGDSQNGLSQDDLCQPDIELPQEGTVYHPNDLSQGVGLPHTEFAREGNNTQIEYHQENVGDGQNEFPLPNGAGPQHEFPEETTIDPKPEFPHEGVIEPQHEFRQEGAVEPHHKFPQEGTVDSQHEFPQEGVVESPHEFPQAVIEPQHEFPLEGVVEPPLELPQEGVIEPQHELPEEGVVESQHELPQEGPAQSQHEFLEEREVQSQNGFSQEGEVHSPMEGIVQARDENFQEGAVHSQQEFPQEGDIVQSKYGNSQEGADHYQQEISQEEDIVQSKYDNSQEGAVHYQQEFPQEGENVQSGDENSQGGVHFQHEFPQEGVVQEEFPQDGLAQSGNEFPQEEEPEFRHEAVQKGEFPEQEFPQEHQHQENGLPQEGYFPEAHVSSQGLPFISQGDGLSDFELYMSEITTDQQMRSELDQYLEESLMPRQREFDILGWWRLNKSKYPTLSNMACDILSIPFSTQDPESVFSTDIKKMGSYRSSLHPVTLEALICAKDWFKNGL